MPIPTTPERNNAPVPLTPEQQQKLQQEFRQANFTQITDFLQEWCRQSDSLGEPPTEAEVRRILYDRVSICEYWLIDGFCRILLNRPYRDYSLKPVSPILKQAIEEKLQQFKYRQRISWREFSQLWTEKLNDFNPPSSETIRKFLTPDRDTCEHWVINGLCQILFDCSCDEWMAQWESQDNLEGDKAVESSGSNSEEIDLDLPPKTANVRPRETTVPFLCRSWEESPDISVFYGREEELATLGGWMVGDRCRLVVLLGMGGIGKTYLSVRCGQQIQKEFEYVKWLSLRHAPPLKDILARVIQFLSHKPNIELPETGKERVSLLMNYLRTHRCLLILDEWEAILASGELAGQYRAGYEDYGELLAQIGKEKHKSCLLLASREPSYEMNCLAAQSSKNKIFNLQGLKATDARSILENYQLEEPKHWDKLIQLYRGNPLALIAICPIIKDLFNGRVGSFLKKNTVVVNDALQAVLKQHFETVSALEKEIMYWLAIARKPIGSSNLKPKILSPISESEFLEAMKSLGWRSLVERSAAADEAHFTLEPAVMKYITKDLIEQVCQEISEVMRSQKLEKLNRMRTHQLVSSRELDPDLRAIQIRLILTPIQEKLATILRSDRRLAAYLNQLLSMLEGKSALEVGYALDNLQNLLDILPKSDA